MFRALTSYLLLPKYRSVKLKYKHYQENLWEKVSQSVGVYTRNIEIGLSKTQWSFHKFENSLHLPKPPIIQTLIQITL